MKVNETKVRNEREGRNKRSKRKEGSAEEIREVVQSDPREVGVRRGDKRRYRR